MGISTSSASNIEAGKREPSIETISRWAETAGYAFILTFTPVGIVGSADLLATQRAVNALSPADLARVRDLAERLGGSRV